MIKVLSIGNSFSQDAHRWFQAMADAAGDELQAANLYIGGCSLEQHWQNTQSGEAAYEYQVCDRMLQMVSIEEALQMQDWDVITFQQASHYSYDYATYQPYLKELWAFVHSRCPGVKPYIHETWAYERTFVERFHPGNPDEATMYRNLHAAYTRAAQEMGFSIIPSGTVVQRMRQELPAFDRDAGGLVLTRDGFHLSLDYGRYAAAAAFYATLGVGDLRSNPLLPEKDGCVAQADIIAQIKGIVLEECSKEGAV